MKYPTVEQISHSQNIDKHFIYFYFNRNNPEKIRQVVTAHINYWKTANLKNIQADYLATAQLDSYLFRRPIWKRQKKFSFMTRLFRKI